MNLCININLFIWRKRKYTSIKIKTGLEILFFYIFRLCVPNNIFFSFLVFVLILLNFDFFLSGISFSLLLSSIFSLLIIIIIISFFCLLLFQYFRSGKYTIWLLFCYIISFHFISTNFSLSIFVVDVKKFDDGDKVRDGQAFWDGFSFF